MIYIPIWDHYLSGSNRNNAGQIDYSEVFIMETIMSLSAAIGGNHRFKYNLLNFKHYRGDLIKNPSLQS